MTSEDIGTSHTSGPDRVRARTLGTVNAWIDTQAEQRVSSAARSGDVGEHLDRLDREWDFERIVEAEAAVTGLVGIMLGAAVDRRFLFIPGFAAGMMLLHALHGWYPLLPLLRRMGVRTQDEIDRERFAVKSLRGDFSELRNVEQQRRAEAAWRAVHA